MKATGNNQSMVKKANQILIIKEVRKSGKLSRSDLAKKLKLSNPSISKNVEDLMRKNLLREVGAVVTDVGRRPMMLEFNRNCGFVAAIDLSSKNIKICISDLNGSIIEAKTLTGKDKITHAMVFDVANALAELVESHTEQYGNLLSICIGSPGNIDPVTGAIRYAVRIEDYKNLDLTDIFKTRFNVPVIVKNDINLAVSGEHTFGVGQGVRNLIYINIDIGIGAGLILNGSLFEGSSGFAGELGMTLISEEKPVDTLATMLNLIDTVKQGYIDGKSTLMGDFISSPDDIDEHIIAKCASSGDKLCTDAIHNFAKMHAMIIGNLNELFDPEMIIIGGAVTALGDLFLNDVHSLLAKNCINSNSVTVRYSHLGGKAALFGAISEASDTAIKLGIEKNTQQ